MTMTGDRRKPTKRLQALLAGASAIAILLAASAGTASAQDGTWETTPGSGDYNTGTNWDTGTVPGSGDTASFGVSNTTALTFSATDTVVGGLTFEAGASAYTFTVPRFRSLEFDGDGVEVIGGSAAIILSGGLGGDSDPNAVTFLNSSTAGTATITVNPLSSVYFRNDSSAAGATISNGSSVQFLDDSTAGTSTILNQGGVLAFLNSSTAAGSNITSTSSVTFSGNSTAGGATIAIDGGITNFLGASTAGSATIANASNVNFLQGANAGSAVITNNSLMQFRDDSSAENSDVTNDGTLYFQEQATAGDATITNNERVEFYTTSTAGSAAITNNVGGDIYFHDGSNAGDATFTNHGRIGFLNSSSAGDAKIDNFGGRVNFAGSSTAGNATINNLGTEQVNFQDTANAGSAIISNNGEMWFFDNSSAATATITNDGRMVFEHTTTAGDATITNNDTLRFFSTSTAGNATLINSLGGEIDFSATTGPASDGQISAGSIAGAGAFYLGARTLTVGGNGLSTEVSGVISECGASGTDCLTPGVGGSLVKVGAGTLTLSGINTYTGSTTVNAGTLDVAGSLISAVTVNSGGTLSGIGTIGGLTLNSGGVLSPGNSIGTLNVAGDATFNAGSVYIVELEAPDQADLLSVTGAATINGGEVQVTKLSAEASYLDGQTYRIIEAGTVVNNGGFTFANPFLFLSSELEYGATYVDIVLTAGAPGQDFTSVANTFNQFQAATGLNDLEQSGDALAVYNELLLMTDADEARRAFDLSSGEIHASGQHVIDQTFGLFSRMLRGQASAGLGGVAGGQVLTAPLAYGPSLSAGPGVLAIDDATTSVYANSRVAQAWLAPLGGRGTIDADGNAAALNWWAAGLAGGYEGPIEVASGQAYAGFGLGYIRSHGSVDARLSTFDADGFHIGAYGGWSDGPWSLAGSLAYAANRISTERRIVFGGIDQTATADYWNHTIGFSGEALYGFDMGGGTTLSPLATLDAGWSGHGGFTETGAGALSLTGASESWTRLDTGLGIALSHIILTESGKVTLDGRAVWEHAFADVVPNQSLAFAGSPTGFTVNGPDAGRDRFRLGAGVSFEATEDLTIRASYSGLFSGSQQNHSASLGLNVKF